MIHQRFLQSSQTAKQLNEDVTFVFDEECMKAFNDLKTKLVSAPVITAPDWGQEFELMCSVSSLSIY